MNELVDLMRKVLADSFAFYLKAHNFHWNVEGHDFKQFHDLFSGIYEEVYGSIDTTAEEIRALDAFAPGSLKVFSELTSIADNNNALKANEMAQQLLIDNQKVLATLMEAYRLADRFNELGLANYLQDRMDAHKKHGWMLRATTKGGEE